VGVVEIPAVIWAGDVAPRSVTVVMLVAAGVEDIVGVVLGIGDAGGLDEERATEERDTLSAEEVLDSGAAEDDGVVDGVPEEEKEEENVDDTLSKAVVDGTVTLCMWDDIWVEDAAREVGERGEVEDGMVVAVDIFASEVEATLTLEIEVVGDVFVRVALESEVVGTALVVESKPVVVDDEDETTDDESCMLVVSAVVGDVVCVSVPKAVVLCPAAEVEVAFAVAVVG
jgi:hypothetical protein